MLWNTNLTATPPLLPWGEQVPTVVRGEAPGRGRGWHRDENKTRKCQFSHGETAARNWPQWLTIFPMIPVPTDSVMISLMLLSWSFLANTSSIIPTRRTICTCRNKRNPEMPAGHCLLCLMASFSVSHRVSYSTPACNSTQRTSCPKASFWRTIYHPPLAWAYYISHSGVSLQAEPSCEVTDTSLMCSRPFCEVPAFYQLCSNQQGNHRKIPRELVRHGAENFLWLSLRAAAPAHACLLSTTAEKGT